MSEDSTVSHTTFSRTLQYTGNLFGFLTCSVTDEEKICCHPKELIRHHGIDTLITIQSQNWPIKDCDASS